MSEYDHFDKLLNRLIKHLKYETGQLTWMRMKLAHFIDNVEIVTNINLSIMVRSIEVLTIFTTSKLAANVRSIKERASDRRIIRSANHGSRERWQTCQRKSRRIWTTTFQIIFNGIEAPHPPMIDYFELVARLTQPLLDSQSCEFLDNSHPGLGRWSFRCSTFLCIYVVRAHFPVPRSSKWSRRSSRSIRTGPTRTFNIA